MRNALIWSNVRIRSARIHLTRRLLTPLALVLTISSSAVTALNAAPLHQNLPAGTGAYLRLPSLWEVLQDPPGRSLHMGGASLANQQAVGAIQQKLAALDDLPPQAEAFVKFWAADMRAPLEIAVLTSDGALSPTSQFVFSTRIDPKQPQALTRWKQLLLTIGAQTSPMAADGSVQAVFSMGGNVELPKGPADSAFVRRFTTAQARIDQSGQGFFAYFDGPAVRQALMLAAARSGAPSKAMIDNINGTDAIALGAGTVAGDGRLGLDWYAAKAPMLQYFPQTKRVLDFKTAGIADWIFSAALPTDAEWPRLRARIAADAGEKAAADLEQVLDRPIDAGAKSGGAKSGAAKSGAGKATARDLLRAFGPEFAAFSDAAGDFSAVRLRDQVAFARILSTLETLGSTYRVRGGVHELLLSFDPSAMEKMFATSAEAKLDTKTQLDTVTVPQTAEEKAENKAQTQATERLLAVWLRANSSRIFWVQEGPWLIAASVPQALRDRAKLRASVPASARAGGEVPLAGVSSATNKMAMRTWYGYVSALGTLASVANYDIDLSTLPSAQELQLPINGQAGVMIESAADRLSFSLRYQNTALDTLGGGSATTGIATAAILAAIALPAYQDYSVRAKVAAALAQASGAKVGIAEEFATQGKLPKVFALSNSANNASEPYQIAWQNGAIEISFTDAATGGLAGTTLVLKAVKAADGLNWQCGEQITSESARLRNTVPTKFLPSNCR